MSDNKHLERFSFQEMRHHQMLQCIYGQTTGTVLLQCDVPHPSTSVIFSIVCQSCHAEPTTSTRLKIHLPVASTEQSSKNCDIAKQLTYHVADTGP